MSGIGWEKPKGNNGSGGSYDDTVIKNQIRALDGEINELEKSLNQLIENDKDYDDTDIRNQINALDKKIDELNELDINIKTKYVGNLVNPSDIEDGVYYNYATGKLTTRTDISSTGYIYCEPNENFIASFNNEVRGGNVTFWDSNYTYISGIDVNKDYDTYFTVPNNEQISYFRMSFYLSEKDKYMINRGKTIIPYATFSSEKIAYYFDKDVKSPNIELLEKQNKASYTNDFIQNSHIDYAYDENTGANYTIIRVYRQKIDGTYQFPFVYCPSGLTSSTMSTYDMVISEMGKNNAIMLAINGGVFNTSTTTPDGIVIQNGQVIQNEPATGHPGSKPLTIDSNGNLGYAEANADASQLVANGIISAVCGFMPIVRDYAKIPSTEWNSMANYTQNAQRQIIGQFGNGDYGIITCEGRDIANSDGWTIEEAQNICIKHGLKFAYNLDGGGSTETVLHLKHFNTIYEGSTGRKIPTYIIFNGTTSLINNVGNGVNAIVDVGQADVAIIENEQATFLNENGELNIEWKTGDIISSLRLNQMVDYINENGVQGEYVTDAIQMGNYKLQYNETNDTLEVYYIGNDDGNDDGNVTLTWVDNMNVSENGYINTDDTVSMLSDNVTVASDYTYFIKTTAPSVRIAYYRSTGGFISRSDTITNDGNEYALTIPEGCAYFRIRAQKGSGEVSINNVNEHVQIIQRKI